LYSFGVFESIEENANPQGTAALGVEESGDFPTQHYYGVIVSPVLASAAILCRPSELREVIPYPINAPKIHLGGPGCQAHLSIINV
jgi:hypothetical protein